MQQEVLYSSISFGLLIALYKAKIA